MPTTLLLSTHNLSEWSARAATTPTPGGRLPYGLQYLESQFLLRWSDSQSSNIWRTKLPRAVGGAIRRGAPGLQGSLAAFYIGAQLRTADVALSIFENIGLGFARWQRLALSSGHVVPHIMLTCWLAEHCQHMSPSQLRSVRRSIHAVSTIAVFSANQASILQERLGVNPERIAVVPFGVDSEYYSEANSDQVGGGGLLAVGGDSCRDYATLLEAVRMADVPLTLVCYPRNIDGLDLPPRTTLLSGIPHCEYRQLLRAADLVVTPTVAPAYPSGQSVVLEAMSMRKATLTTDSLAMRDYVTDGVDGALIPPSNPVHMAEAIRGLLADDAQRQYLGQAAVKTVRERFSLTHFWQSVGGLLKSACKDLQPGIT